MLIIKALYFKEWDERELNPRHMDFQSIALPTELSSQKRKNA